MVFELALGLVAVLAGAVASVAGFGIGSLLTPVLAWRIGAKLAVAVVALPHVAGTALRFWMLRTHVDRRLLWTFGVASAVCGFIGAVLHAYLTGSILARVFGGILILAGISTLSGLTQRLNFGPVAAWIAGAISGIFGGLVGSQGTIRSAALLGFRVARDAFVATATAIALLVDLGRVPVYLATQRHAIAQQWLAIVIGVLGVLLGTIFGAALLRRIPQRVFRAVVGVLVVAVGIYMIVRPLLGRTQGSPLPSAHGDRRGQTGSSPGMTLAKRDYRHWAWLIHAGVSADTHNRSVINTGEASCNHLAFRILTCSWARDRALRRPCESGECCSAR